MFGYSEKFSLMNWPRNVRLQLTFRLYARSFILEALLFAVYVKSAAYILGSSMPDEELYSRLLITPVAQVWCIDDF